ncbi:MAG TPA: hypothetical protein DCP25_07720 [Chloroflexi bacterium]|nr:hypothetical protein [Chloroflexota bacterium]
MIPRSASPRIRKPPPAPALAGCGHDRGERGGRGRPIVAGPDHAALSVRYPCRRPEIRRGRELLEHVRIGAA